ncbi:MAG: phenylalanine--tRNA ligase subunit beta [Pirellulaceae bacterium]|nr:phenylalanine--tRNA ligase subunit beta [Thermoguttaceae bacterium]MDI9442607.1 phenylalanine--tRNA ligase subunit beta [Planctomycetota bacterium]NLY99377.1 phenylalanine--tRNA ligase subunit beta [Pirellulaceae bacterium]
MKISLDWISDFVDLSDLDPETIADRLTLATAEVEGFEVLRRSVEGVVAGEVLSVEAIAEGDPAAEGISLAVVQVDCGGRKYQTVCGAPNVRVGMKAPFAPPGARLAGETRIRSSELHGHKSEGVLCSPAELGMSRWHEGLLELPEEIAPGTPLAELIPAEDVIIEVDNKSLTHRPDLWGHYGFARELAAIFQRPLKALPMADLAADDHLPAYPLSVEDFDNCPCYGCIELECKATIPSPVVMQRRLHALGQRTFNLMVDVTNYVMLELGQPTHAFDGGRLRAIRVATMGAEGTFTTLDGQERKMLPEDLLIWNEREPVALAGVMGGLNSEVEESTTKVLLESANFKASRIRRTSARLDLRSESAQRFEKTQPPVNVKLALGRILKLVDEAGAEPKATSRMTIAGDLKNAFRPVALPPGSLAAMAGAEIPDAEVVAILHGLGFTAQFAPDGTLQVGVPPHRSEKDISIPPDIAEEVLRVYGYGKIEPRMPRMPLAPLAVDKKLRIEHKARRLLAAGHRFAEVHNYGWTDDNWLARLKFAPQGALALANPITQPCRLLRTTLMPNLLALVEANCVHRDAFRLFELGRVYRAAGDGGCEERTRLGGISYQQSPQPSLEQHLRIIKGAIEDLARMIGGEPFAFVPGGEGRCPWHLPGHWVAIRSGGRTVGGLGALASGVLQTVSPQGGQVVWFELEFDLLEGPIFPAVAYEAPPRYPGSWQDFSLVWDLDKGFAALEEVLSTFTHPLVIRREFVADYKGKGLPPGKGSYSYRFWLGAADHTLTSDEIEGFRAAILEFFKEREIPLR